MEKRQESKPEAVADSMVKAVGASDQQPWNKIQIRRVGGKEAKADQFQVMDVG